MKKVTLKAMHIANFKGIKDLDAQFGYTTSVMGANGTGKSTLYDSYLWCLFGKNFLGNEIAVQPLNNDNEIQHKLVTEVSVILDVDGVEVQVCRKQSEKWTTPRGLTTEVLQGNEQERIINGTPYGVREFKERLCEICDVDDWFMLSSISAFMGLKMEVRRQKLQKLANAISDEEIAADYPTVLKAFKEGKTVDELKRQIKLTKDTAKTEFDQIPARIDQQEKLRVSIDVPALEKEKADLASKKAIIEKELSDAISAKPENAANQFSDELSKADAEIARIESDARAEVEKKNAAIHNEIYSCESELQKARLEESTSRNTLERINAEKAVVQGKFDAACTGWRTVNTSAYEDTIETVCPVCGQNIPEDRVEEARTKAIEDFNNKKRQQLSEYEKEGGIQKKRLAEIDTQIENSTKSLEFAQATIESVTKKLSDAREKLNGGTSVQSILDSKPEYAAAKSKREDIVKAMQEASAGNTSAQNAYKEKVDEINVRLREVSMKLDDVNRQLFAVDTNGRIDAEKKNLEKRQTELAQAIADAEKVEMEIMLFKKRKITLVEQAVSSLFEIVKWKMFEQNLTNDGEKELCQAITDGKPYEDQNTAMKFNMAIDIINGLSKAMDVYVPLFVDNKESVTDLRPTITQLITLTVAPGRELTIQ